MTQIEKLVRFNQKFNNDGRGGPFSLVGRDYVVNEIWRPLHSYRAWPAEGVPLDALCPLCRARVDAFVDQPNEASPHAPTSRCPGLIGWPIITTGVDVPRRTGKTTNGLAIPFGVVYLSTHERWAYIASAEDQAEVLVAENLAKKIKSQPSLDAITEITANMITVPANNSTLEVLSSSAASSTGRGYTGIIIDEARDLDARIIAALLPSILAEHGYKCPRGHGRVRAIGDDPDVVPEFPVCQTCGSALRRWHARLLIMSASGIIEDRSERDWFRDWIDMRIEKPDPTIHVWRTDKRVNPSVSTMMTNALRTGFGDVPGMKDYLSAELDNVSVRRGETFLTKPQLDVVVDRGHRPIERSTKPAVGFIDTSRTGDKTSLVIVVDDSIAGEPTFTRLALAHVKVWNPKDPASCPGGTVDQVAVEAHLDQVVPNFSSLHSLQVDTRVMPWAKLLVVNCRRKSWGRRIDGFQGDALANSAMYLELLDRIIGSNAVIGLLLRLFPHPELEQELLALRKTGLPRGGIAVYDAGAGKDGRNRKTGGVHRDIAMSLAACCLRASELRIEAPSSASSVKALEAELDEIMDDPIMGGIAKGRF